MIESVAVDMLDELCGEEPGAALAGWVIVAAHPDDEVIGMGSRLPRLRDPVLVHVTDGAPRSTEAAPPPGCASREAYAQLRRRELEQALALTQIESFHTVELGCVDQEAAANMAELTQQLLEVLERFDPAAVLTHPYEGGHPDHDATAFAVHAACALLGRRRGRAVPLVEMTSYHTGPDGLMPGEFLPAAVPVPVRTVHLDPEQQHLKRQLMECFASQAEVLRYFPVTLERFRPAPKYDFTAAPHPGRLFYEHYDWGMDGQRWRELAASAIEQLEIEKGR